MSRTGRWRRRSWCTVIKRLLVAGDTHGDTEHCEYLNVVAVEKGCDAVYIVGDFGYWEHMSDGVTFLDDLDAIAAESGVDFYWNDGNHDKISLALRMYGDQRDDEGFILVRPHVHYAWRGHRWTWNGVRFIALGGAYSVDKEYRLAWERDAAHKRAMLNVTRLPENQLSEDTAGMQWFPEEEMTDNELDTILLTDSSPVDIMLTHDKPASSNPFFNRKNIAECMPNQKRMQRAMETLRPRAFIHGHLHHRYVQHQLGEDDWRVTVIGLDCNTAVQEYKADPKRSWMVLDLEKPLALPED